MECNCESCISACSQKPGWFIPDQIKKVSKHMNISEKELFDKYLLVDWFVGLDSNDYEDVFILSPAIVGVDAGNMFPGKPSGQCVFFNKEKLCDIHEVKPFECSKLECSTSLDNVNRRHKKVAESWVKHQENIEILLGYSPVAEEVSFIDSFMW